MRLDRLDYQAQVQDLIARDAELPSKERIFSNLIACLFAATLFQDKAPQLSGKAVAVLSVSFGCGLYHLVMRPTYDKLAMEKKENMLIALQEKATQRGGWVRGCTIMRLRTAL